jgi:PAS domain S-box-containing protein
MASSSSSHSPPNRLLSLSAALSRAETVETAVAHAIELAEAVFEQPVAGVWEYDPGSDTATAIGPDAPPSGRSSITRTQLPESILDRLDGDEPRAADTPRATVTTDPREPLRGEVRAAAFVPLGRNRGLYVGTRDRDGFDEGEVATVEGIATNLDTALARIDRQRETPAGDQSGSRRAGDTAEADTAALRRLHELIVDAGEFDATVDRLLSLGRDHLGLDTAILARVDGDDYEVEAVVDATGTHEAGAVYDLGETMCRATLADGRTGPLAFADVADTEHRGHPAADGVSAYVGVPVVVDGQTYGTVNFSMGRPREEAFRPEETEFVRLVAEWVGTELERRRRFEELERYETILEAIDDPVYALDADGRFTFVNEAAKREFGYGPEILGEQPSIAMDDSDVEQIREQIGGLVASGGPSTTAEFELETADGGRKIVENRLALIGDEEFRGTAGVLRDITDRKQRQRQLESFQRAIESAEDGVAVLDGDEYTYVDETHAEMYGFEDEEQLLGNTWRELYDDDEIARLEREALPVLETEGHWRGLVTGSRPNGSTFPAELSLTAVDDGRIVCTVRDVTERQERRRWLQRFLNRGPLMSIQTRRVDGEAVVDSCNDRFLDRLGYDRGELAGEPLASVYTADSGSALAEDGYDDALAGEFGMNERTLQGADGEQIHTLLRAAPRQDETAGTYALFVDISERKERERQTEQRVEFLERIYEVTTDPEMEFEEKISGLLAAGRDHLDLPYGFLTRIERGDGSTPDTQTIVEALGSHELLQPGESAPLSRSYCRKTIEQNDPMALTNAAEAGWVGDPAHEMFELETYIGGDVVAGDDLYGTLCFASNEPRETAFDEFERSFVSLVGRWAGYEIDRRDAREQLEQQRERLDLTLSGTNTGLAEWDLETDAVTWNETLVDIVGRDVGSIVEFRAAVHPEDRDRVQRELETMIETAEPWAGEFRLADDDDGTGPRWLGTRATPVYDSDGEPVRVLATGTDISDRKAAERERQRNERRFESLFDDPGMLVGLLDTDGRLLDANETATSYVDATLEELRGQPFPETPWWTHSEDLVAEVRGWIQRAADGEYVEYSATHPGPDGDRRHITGTVRPVTDHSGTVRSLFVTGRDVTEREQQQRELRDRQRKLDLVLSNTDTSVVELDLGEGTLHWDGMAGDNDIGSPETLEAFVETVHPDDRERVQSDIEEAFGSSEPVDGEYRLVDEDGNLVWVAVQAVSVADETDGSGRVVAIATDITGLKEREHALEESQDRYQTLLEAAPDPVFVADAETGEIVEANAAAEEITGLSRADLVGRSQTALHPEGDADLYREAFEQSGGSSRMISALPSGEQPKLRSADGGTVPVEINADTVQLPSGPVTYGVFRDISERRQRERELELKERAMDEANLGITISDPDREDNPLIYVNDGFVEQTGYTSADAIARNCRFLQADDRDQSALDDLREAIAAEEAITVELRNYRKDGEQFWNRLSVTPVYDEHDRLTHYIGIQQDVTEEKTREQRLRALNATTRELLQADGADEATAVAVETLAEEFEFHLAGVFLREGEELVRTASTDELPDSRVERVERGQTPLWEAIETGAPVHYSDAGEIADDLDRGETAASAYVPVGDHGAIAVGVTDPDRLGESERRFVEMLAGNLASVLDTLERERELIEERERFRLLTESVDEYAFLVVDGDGTIQTWNESAGKTFGYDAAAAVGMPMAELHPEADRESELPDRLLQQARVAGESAHEGWRVRADGSEFYAESRHAPLDADDDEFRGYALIVRDMTDRRRQQRRTERFVEQSDDVVTILDTDGTITYASGSADRVLGYDPDELVGENLFDYLHPDNREAAMEMIFSGMEDPGTDRRGEYRLESGDGEWLNVEGQCRNMLDDDAIDGMLLYLRDVTDETERARRFESIFNQTFQFTGLLEPDGTVVEANDAALEFGGVDRDAIVGNLFFDAPWWTHSDEVRENVRDAIERAAGGEFVRYETEVRGADGLGTIDFSVKPVFDDDGDVSLLVVEGRDITTQQQHRQHLEVMQRVMRHNMRNDLTKVRGWTQVMSEEADAEKRAEQFETVERILDKWEAMAGKMKEIRQVIHAQSDEQATVEAGSLIEDAVAPVREEYPDATIRTDVSGNESAEIAASLLEAVRELAENAADVQDEATVEVGVDTPDDDWIEIGVRDDGPGMPDMETDVLETGEETPLNHGQGLGLWMVRTIVMQAGGNVSVESTAEGTEVCLRLPTGRSEAEGSVETAG